MISEEVPHAVLFGLVLRVAEVAGEVRDPQPDQISGHRIELVVLHDTAQIVRQPERGDLVAVDFHLDRNAALYRELV